MKKRAKEKTAGKDRKILLKMSKELRKDRSNYIVSRAEEIKLVSGGILAEINKMDAIPEWLNYPLSEFTLEKECWSKYSNICSIKEQRFFSTLFTILEETMFNGFLILSDNKIKKSDVVRKTQTYINFLRNLKNERENETSNWDNLDKLIFSAEDYLETHIKMEDSLKENRDLFHFRYSKATRQKGHTFLICKEFYCAVHAYLEFLNIDSKFTKHIFTSFLTIDKDETSYANYLKP